MGGMLWSDLELSFVEDIKFTQINTHFKIIIHFLNQDFFLIF